MERPKKGKLTGAPPIYEESFKIAVAREYLEGNLSQSQLARKHGLRDGDVISYFVTWYKKNLQDSLSINTAAVPVLNTSAQSLQEELRLARLKITALEMMINIAEKELDIAIRKKSGTKPPAK